jgi:hypothetical protein
MGTNYYVVENVCECCNRYDEKFHIGKHSYGWAFIFQGYKYDGLTTWQKWKEYLKGQIIRNEYGENVPYEEFVELVEVYAYPNKVVEQAVTGIVIDNKNLKIELKQVNTEGRKLKSHNEEGRKEGWFNSEHDWDDPEGYSFGSREFS